MSGSRKLMFRGGGCDVPSATFFSAATQGSQWVSGIPFASTADNSGNQNGVLAAYGSAESAIPYRQDVVMYDGSGISAPLGTVFSTGAVIGGGGTKAAATKAKAAKAKAAKAKAAKAKAVKVKAAKATATATAKAKAAKAKADAKAKAK